MKSTSPPQDLLRLPFNQLAGQSVCPNQFTRQIKLVFTATKSAAKPAPLLATAPAPARSAVPTQQQTFDERLQPASTGSRFERTKPTVEEGEDLDVPTFLRRKR